MVSESSWRVERMRVRRGERGVTLVELIIVLAILSVLATAAIIRVLEDGTIVLNTGAVDIGQGSDTVLTQMCADSLEIPADRVVIGSPDTDSSPYNWGTTASRVTYMVGRAIVAAAAEVEEKLKAHAADIFEC